MRRPWVAAILWLVLAAPAVAADRDDHRLITRYPGSTVTEKVEKAFETFPLIVALAAGNPQEFESRPVEGRLTQIRYGNPRGRSVAEIFANYEQALRRAGFVEIWRCADAGCGPTFASSRWTRFNGTINIGSDSRYLVGSLRTAGGEAFVAVAVNRTAHQLTIVEVQAMQAGLVTVDATALGRDLDAQGHVAIPGVHFETGKADLRPESDAALAAMAEILKARPGIRVWVVGHTDWVGAFDLNLRLSDARAKAVAAALVARHGIARDRLEGHGVGPLAPTAPNAAEAGRATNRRVELVLRP